MIEQLTQLNFIKGLPNVGQTPTICVEAGHIYTDETPSLKHEIGAMVGAKVSSLLEEMGFSVQRMLFIDDYNAVSNDLDIGSYQSLLQGHGFAPEVTVMESSLTQNAQEIVETLEKQGLTEENRNGTVVLKKGHKREKDIVLKKSPGMGLVPSCAALDAALYLKKFETVGVCVTVLHQEWKGQQEGVKKVLNALGKSIPILEVYYTDDGDIEFDFDY